MDRFCYYSTHFRSDSFHAGFTQPSYTDAAGAVSSDQLGYVIYMKPFVRFIILLIIGYYFAALVSVALMYVDRTDSTIYYFLSEYEVSELVKNNSGTSARSIGFKRVRITKVTTSETVSNYENR